ncbi:MAG: hypothetical protein WC665_11155 [Sulfurimonas sp.]
MAIFDLFSKRQKKLRGDVSDVYIYDDFSNALRVQIVHIWKDALGDENNYYDHHNEVEFTYKLIVDTLCREYGLFKLPTAEEYKQRMFLSELANFLLQENDIERIIDVIELSFKAINELTRQYSYMRTHNGSERADEAITELNSRFKEHGVGFQFLENEIIRIDSELLHIEAVIPALRLLNQKNYQGAQQEFLSAYEHYRHSKNKEALNDCLKAFESTMKAICDKHEWTYQPNATAKTLIQACFDNNLIPSFWQQQFNSLRSMLESSIPTGRNKLSGHGQGTTPVAVPDYLVAYMLHMTASTLVFLTTAEENLV